MARPCPRSHLLKLESKQQEFTPISWAEGLVHTLEGYSGSGSPVGYGGWVLRAGGCEGQKETNGGQQTSQGWQLSTPSR